MPFSHRHQKPAMGIRRIMSIVLVCIVTWNLLSQLLAPPQNDNDDSFLRATSEANEAFAIMEEAPQETRKEPREELKEPKKELKKPPDQRTVHFLEHHQLDIDDYFSATWIQPLDNFLKVNISNIQTVEDGCFQIFRQDRSVVKMTLDWMDWSVEHYSKWWKVADIFDDDAVPFNRAVTALQAYTRSVTPTKETSPLSHTIAMIAFQPFVDPTPRDDLVRARPLTIHSLAATIASLANVGMGRVVVTGMKDKDQEIVQETFRYLQQTWSNDVDKQQHGTVTKIGNMELGFVKVTKKETKTSSVERNIPKAALQILQQAFSGDLGVRRRRDILGTTTKKSYWKYVYLTEPDTILQTKPYALSQIQSALDQGLVLAPHRLQPIPHEADFIGMKDSKRFVPATGNFSIVLDLNTNENAVCCDEQAKDYKPWQDYFDNCGTFWWDCGFSSNTNYSHVHLNPYSFIRLSQGTGIVSLSATEHGRRCFPSKNGKCTPKK